jgi:putative transposase
MWPKKLCIFPSKKARTQTVEKLTCRYPLLGKSLLCSLFGFSRQAWYATIKQEEKVSFEFDAVLAEILAIRKRIPGFGTAKLFELLKLFLSSHFIKMGRDKILHLLKKEGLLVKKRS